MYKVVVDHHDTCRVHCECGDFDMELLPHSGPSSREILNQAAIHSMETGHIVDEEIRTILRVHPV